MPHVIWRQVSFHSRIKRIAISKSWLSMMDRPMRRGLLQRHSQRRLETSLSCTRTMKDCSWRVATASPEPEGTYTVFLDADDRLAPHALAALAAHIAETGSDIVQYAFCRDPAFRHRIKTFDLSDGEYRGQDFAYVRRQLLAGKMNSIWSRAVRTSLLRTDGFPSDRFQSVMHGEDILRSLHTFDRAASATILAEALYYYRPNDGASTASYRSGQLADIEVVCRELLEVARRWGSDYVPYAMQGAAIQYAYLLNILIGSTDKDVSTELECIAESFERLGGLEVVRGAEAIRVDCLIMLKLLCRRRFRVLRRFAGSIECARRQMRRLISS